MLKLKLLEVQTHCLTSLKARGHVLFIKMTLFTMVTQWPPPPLLARETKKCVNSTAFRLTTC